MQKRSVVFIHLKWEIPSWLDIADPVGVFAFSTNIYSSYGNVAPNIMFVGYPMIW